ncbi:hypothetical protein O181_106871 [Austropuccinia psidii MF-1]|uniref:Uncharacterized protein n=1 Tax=Austropuccinia psidii MF-1 TaxID=1389203 RepID=A0A9Q3PNM2_9BASI|nr:hypothetical protein [Austropuccinia psidii MF-1]
MIQTMEDILRRFCAYGMEYEDHEVYTHDWVTLLPAVQLTCNTTEDFHDMWKRDCHTAARCIAEAKECNKQRWDKCHMEPDFKEGNQLKHPVFPVSVVKPYFQEEEDKFPSRKKNPTPPEIVEVEDSPGCLKEIINPGRSD